MSYTPPLGNAVVFDGAGIPYTPPLGSAVNFDTVDANVVVLLQGLEVTAQSGVLAASVAGVSYSVPLTGLFVTADSGLLVASVPGGSYAVALVGNELTVQQQMLAALTANFAALTSQVATVQRGTLAAVSPTSVSVPLQGQSVTVQRADLLGSLSTGGIQWAFSHSNITLSGSPQLTATAFSSGYPGVYSNGAEEQFGGKRYFEVALTGVGQAAGIGNQWRGLGTTYPLGMSPVGGEDQFSWALWCKADGTLQLNHNAVGTAQGSYFYVAGAPVMCAIDFTNGLLWLGYNGTWVGGGDPASGTSPTYSGVTGFPHPVLICGTTGSNVASTQVLHATVNNQLFRPAGFLPWEDSLGAAVTVGLTGLQVVVQRNSLDILVNTGPDVLLSLRGLPVSIQIGALTVDLHRQHVTWNPNDHSPYVLLTDADMGAQSNNPLTQSTYTARATLGRAVSSGKYYFEITVPFLQDGTNVSFSRGPGISISRQFGATELAENTTWGGFLSKDFGVDVVTERWFNIAADGALIDGDIDVIHGGRARVGDSLGPFVPGYVLQLAVDFNTGKIWFGYNGKWFNSSQGSDPATGTLPQYSNIKTVITSVVGSAEYPACWPDYVLGDPPPPSTIGHFNLASFAFAPPSGFYPWEEGEPTDKVSWLTGELATVEQGRFGVVVVTGNNYSVQLSGLQLTALQGRFVGFRQDGVLFGQQVTVGQGTLTPVVTIVGAIGALVGQSVTVSGGTLTPVVIDGIVVPLVGQEAAVQQGLLTASYSEDRTVALVGQELSVQSGGLTTVVGPTLQGQQLTVECGSFDLASSVKLTGQSVEVLRGMFPYFSVDLAIEGQQCAVQSGVLGTNVTVALIGQSLAVSLGGFTPATSLRLVGARLQVDQGVLATNVAIPLSGPSLVVQQGALGVALKVSLTGMQAAVLQGALDLFYDGNVFPAGVQLLGMVGVEPTETNVKPPDKDTLLWALAEVEKLFVVIEPIE